MKRSHLGETRCQVSGIRPIVALSIIVACACAPQEADAREGALPGEELREIEEIVVTGYRGSLNNTLSAKRNAVSGTESIFAEDIGKFPDLNLAEALQRVSGVAITRDNGEGQQISLRGLGPSFARVLWNGVPISTASNGGTDEAASNRQFDFDVFPSELFGRIDISKTPSAHDVEGGVAGVVNLRNVRPFDFDGFTLNYSAQGAYQSLSDDSDPRLSVIVSNTFDDDRLGVLFGATYSNRSFRVDGFETFDFTSQSVRGFDYELTDGNQSGLSDDDLDRLLLPRLPRTEMQFGDRERVSAMAAIQFRPSADFEINLDALYAKLNTDFVRYNFDAEIRNRNPIPYDAVVGSENTVRSIRLGNVNRRSENRLLDQDAEQINLALTSSWFASESLTFDMVAAYAKSNAVFDSVTFLPRVLGTEIELSLSGDSPIPSITTQTDITDPDNFVLDNVRVQPNDRVEENVALHVNGTWGSDANNFRFGVAYNTFARDWDAASLTGTAILGSNPPALSQITGTVPFDDYLDILDAPAGAVTDHLVVDYDLVKDIYDLGDLAARAYSQVGTLDAIDEDVFSAYVEANAEADVLGNPLRLNAGVRVTHTKVSLLSTFRDSVVEKDNSYTRALPSFNAAWEFSEDVIVRLAGARTLTRPNPAELSRPTNINNDYDVSSGNAELTPFVSDQFDLGVEWYFAPESLVGASLYYKDIRGFLQSRTIDGVLADTGIPIDSLDPQVFGNATPNSPVTISRPENSAEPTIIKGIELVYQQPLSVLFDGLGVLVNYSYIDGKTSFTAAGGQQVPSNIEGLSKHNYNIVVYYEDERFSVRGSWNYRDDFPIIGACCRSGQPFLRTRQGEGQLDVSASYQLPIEWDVAITFEGINLNSAEEYTYFGNTDRLRRLVASGRQFFLGIRGSF